MEGQTITSIRVCLIGSPNIVLYGLDRLIDSQKLKMQVVGKFINFDEACSQLEHLTPDIILLDLNSENRDQVKAIPDLVAQFQAKILIFTNLIDPSTIDFIMLAGAKGILSKKESVETILKAIEKVHEGEIWLDQASVSRILGKAWKRKSESNHIVQKIQKLTQAEKRVLSAIMSHIGAPAKVIAVSLNICESTLRNHLTSIYEKLEVNNKVELWSFMQQHKLIQQL